VDISSIKRKKATLDGMANVLNEFLYGVSKGFQDAAFASFSRRRSTVRSDIAQSFGATAPSEAEAPSKGSEYLDMINVGAPAAAPEAPAVSQGVVDVASKPKWKSRGRKGADEDGLKEI